MRQPWLYFCYRFDTSFVNSLTLSIPYVTCHSVFIDDFKVYRDFVFANDLWISNDIAFLTIPCVSHNSILLSIWCIGHEFIDAVDYIRRLSFSFHWWFQGLQLLCFRRRFMDQPCITFLTIPCSSQDSIFHIDWMRRSWIQWRCWFYTLVVTQYSLTI